MNHPYLVVHSATAAERAPAPALGEAAAPPASAICAVCHDPFEVRPLLNSLSRHGWEQLIYKDPNQKFQESRPHFGFGLHVLGQQRSQRSQDMQQHSNSSTATA